MTALIASTLKDSVSARQLAALTITDCSVKALVGFNGYNMVITTSFSVSSLFDNGVGNWNVYYAAFFETWGLPAGGAHDAGVAWNYVTFQPAQATALTMCVLQTHIVGLTFYDSKAIQMSAVGRLA